MKKLLLLFLLVFVLIGCGGSADISPSQAVKMMEEDPNIVLVDVRTYEEYIAEHIPNAILVPLATLESSAASKIPDKDGTYFVYCRSGNRSATAVSQLKSWGYQ
ncbi:MAG TPA: rhodanese-like domain-containing protein, partial [Bacilli bacterium]|nr:rhodanese-like domain-containing protein [Bacilli bacterium]